jgi:TatD DNase family protein
MYKNIFDSHAHYTDKAFNDDRENMLGSLKESGICGVINCGADLESSKESLVLAEKYDYFYFACGVHPEEVENLPDDYIEILRDIAKHPKCVAIGEIGLDYYWDDSMKEQQKKAFARQVEWGVKYNLPLMIHTRSAHKDMIDIMHEAQSKCGGLLKGVFHCFAGTVDEAREMLAIDNFMIGIGGIATFKKSQLPETIKEAIPLSKIALETDSPYMAPVPHRGKRNESAFVDNVADKIAEIFGCAKETVVRQTTENALSVFRI